MFGLEQNQMDKFEFDLEKEIKKKPARAGEYLKKIEESQADIKAILKGNDKSKEFEDLGHLLQGYDAAKTIINRITKK